jgi:hypothetical protein
VLLATLSLEKTSRRPRENQSKPSEDKTDWEPDA